jgi:hypothetical protein
VSKARYIQSLGGDSAIFAAVFVSIFVSAFVPAFPAVLVSADASVATTFSAVPASAFISAG